MKKSLTSSKNLVLFTLILGLIGSLTTFFFLQEGEENSKAYKSEKRKVETKNQPDLPPKKEQSLSAPLSKDLYVPPETFIDIQHLKFESIKKEIKAQKSKKKTFDNNNYKRKEENHKNVFLSLRKTK